MATGRGLSVDNLTPERKAEIEDRLMAFRNAARQETILFDAFGYINEFTGVQHVDIEGRIQDTDFVVNKDIEDAKASDEVIDVVGADLKRMLELASYHAQSDQFNTLAGSQPVDPE